MKLELVVGLALVCLGLPMTFRAFRSRSKRRALLRNCVRVEGKIVRFEDMPSSQSSISEATTLSTSAAVVEYRDKKRKRHVLKLPERSYHQQRVGAKVIVYFEQGRPGNATTIGGMWDVNVICGISLAVLLIGAGFLYTAYQKEQSEAGAETEEKLWHPRRSQWMRESPEEAEQLLRRIAVTPKLSDRRGDSAGTHLIQVSMTYPRP